MLPYIPSKLAFQFIGDSLSAVSIIEDLRFVLESKSGVVPGSQGQYLPEGVDQAWPFLTGEYFKAEHRINAKPGAALSVCFHFFYLFFIEENVGYC